MSDWELRFFYLLEWSDAVKDIREQYPLLDLDLAMGIADETGIEYPKDKKSGTPYVLTTDFMLTVKQGKKLVQIARTVKLAKDLDKKRVLEKLQLEKHYWNRQNIDWAIVTEQEISKILADNIKWVHPAYKWELTDETNNGNCYYLSNLLKNRLINKKNKISTITQALDREMGISSGTSLSLFKHLVARKEIIVDMLGEKLSSSSSSNIIKKVI
ncbi:MAG: TnsA endonuclease N-terminal domain-containing protein [Xenococcaceae cyanobacterium MO_167.B27]|nr:TnsA endonuclease N-terminal domain-containing protein [Xenococcaceae cyanobacterium MO_167.B27]